MVSIKITVNSAITRHYSCVKCKYAISNRPTCSTPVEPDVKGYSEDHSKSVSICNQCKTKQEKKPTASGQLSLSNFFSKKAPVSSQNWENSESASYQREMKKQKVDIPETTPERSAETSPYQQDETKKQKVKIPQTPIERSISFQLIKEEEIRDQIIISFINVFHDIYDYKIHNYNVSNPKTVKKFVQQIVPKCQKTTNASINGYLIQNWHFVIKLISGV